MRTTVWIGGTVIACAAVAWVAAAAHAQAPRALPEGTLPDDARLGPPRHLDGEHPFHPVVGAEEWEKRAAQVRRRVAIAAGLWPMPTKAPLVPSIHGRIDKGDYTIEKVSFESFPGHFVTGNLYRPAGRSLPAAAAGKTEKLPGVLCPHGHWPKGRFMDLGEQTAAKEVAIGAERFPNGGRSPLQARCIGLARLGCVVFHYDMLGNADSLQFPAHRRGPHEPLDGREPGGWGFVGFEALARLQSRFGLQTFNSVCAMDFIRSLPDVDPERIAVTGASGGGTQTMMVTALDDRVSAAFPCVMVSTSMQGGCPCENAPLLRIGQGNIDIAALTAPRPLGLTAADDWTKQLEQKGYPDLVSIYRMLGVPDRLEAHFDVQFKHNYNGVARSHCYRFLDRHFGLGHKDPGDERDFDLLTQESLTVWDEAHPAPHDDAVGDSHERHVCRLWTEDADRMIVPLLEPQDGPQLAKAREILGGGFSGIIGRSLPAEWEIGFEPAADRAAPERQDTHTRRLGTVFNRTHGERIPVVVLRPHNWMGGVVVWLHPEGKDGLFEKAGDGAATGRPVAAVRAVLERGVEVVAADLFGQGEFLAEGAAPVDNPRVAYPGPTEPEGERWRLDPVYFFGYNDSVYSRRVHDALTLVSFANAPAAHDGEAKRVTLVGLAGAGHWAAGAVAATRPWEATDDVRRLDAAVIDPAGFRFEKLPSLWHADFLPGAVKYGDLPGMMVLAAPLPLVLAGPDPRLAPGLAAAYEAAGCPSALRTDERPVAAGSFDPDHPPAWLDFLSATQPATAVSGGLAPE